jgi:hypothetical protein
MELEGKGNLVWRPIRVKLGDLDGWEENPKVLTNEQFKRLLKSTEKLGQMQTIAVSPLKQNGRRDIYDGHQRNSVWLQSYHPDLEVWAMEASRHLTDDERRDIAMLTTTARGSFNWDVLSGWDLREYLNENDLANWRSDVTELSMYLTSNYVPDFVEREVDQKDIERAQKQSQYKDVTDDLITLICPHCGNEFQVKRKTYEDHRRYL